MQTAEAPRCSECGREMGIYDYACSDECANARADRIDAANKRAASDARKEGN